MDDSIQTFRVNITRAKNLGGIHNVLESKTTSILDITDILRAELVMAVSAVDHFIHSIVEEGMLEIYQNLRPRTDAYNIFESSLENIPCAITDPAYAVWFKDEIHRKHSYLSFQRAEKISSVVKIISDKDIWNETSQIMNISKNDLITQLNLIVDRRNTIAHEADVDPTYPNKRWGIDFQLVDDSVEFLEKLSESLFQVVK